MENRTKKIETTIFEKPLLFSWRRIKKLFCCRPLFYRDAFAIIVPLILPTTALRCRSGTVKKILEDLFSSLWSQFKKYHPSGNLKFNYLSIFQSLKLRILIGKFVSISLNLNFTTNTFGCYGLRYLITEPNNISDKLWHNFVGSLHHPFFHE